METTGIVRRIDELGRIVIPKEIRRTMRLKEGEELEICLGQDQLVFKKYSAMGSIGGFAAYVAEALQAETGGTVFVTDGAQVISSRGAGKSADGAELSPEFCALLQGRTPKRLTGEQIVPVTSDNAAKCAELLVVPVLVGGDLFGAVAAAVTRSGQYFDSVKLCARILEKAIG